MVPNGSWDAEPKGANPRLPGRRILTVPLTTSALTARANRGTGRLDGPGDAAADESASTAIPYALPPGPGSMAVWSGAVPSRFARPILGPVPGTLSLVQ